MFRNKNQLLKLQLFICQNALRGRLTLSKGDKPYMACDLVAKLGQLWKTTSKWKLVSLGRGYCDFHFEFTEDLSCPFTLKCEARVLK